MKITYIFLYCLSIFLFLFAILGNSLTKPAFSSISERTLGYAGFDKSYLESADDKIDELIYQSKQIQLQIEKIKKFFSSDKPDESKYQKEKGQMLEKTFYNPLVSIFNYIYRIGFVLIAFITLSFAVIFHLGYRSLELRRRVRRLEEIVLSQV